MVTVFQNDRIETDQTDKTDIKSNHDFLRAIFGTIKDETRPVLVSFGGNPHTVPKKHWFGEGWNPALPDYPTVHNNYFSISLYHPTETGTYRRKKEFFCACYALMLDDIGTKVPIERMTLAPSWLIETSEGNHQAGYILSEPIADEKYVDRIMKAIIGAGLCDAGADGPTARLARLPLGSNGKKEPAFQCQLIQWNPELRYSAEDLVHKLELDLDDTPKKQKTKSKAQKLHGDEDIFIARPSDNPIIAALKARGLYKTPLDGVKHDITCPWVHEHTDQVDGGTVYFEPDDTYPIGGFKCQHGHCADRHIRELLAALNIESGKARMKPTIRQIAGEIHRISDRAEQALSEQRRYYQRGGLIVTITNSPETRETSVKDLSQPALLSALSCAAQWERHDSRSGDWVIIDPPAKIVSVLYDAMDYRHLDPLNGLCHQPYLRQDYSLCTLPGYDKKTGMFGTFDARKFVISEQPNRQDAENALREIENLISEFSFRKDTDRAAAFAAILTAAIRPCLATAPMFHIKAPQISSGKSYLCSLISAFASAKKGSPTSFPHDDEECRKLLLAELLRAPAVIEFDNVTSDIIPHKSLCTALTSEFLTGRILGVSKTATVSTRTLFLASGNNVSPIQDMTRRCITITLDTKCERPVERVYRNPNLIDDVLKDREKFVSHALTLIRAWIVAGKPKIDCKPLASYGEWSDLCRQPLLWLGLPDCTESVTEAMAEDPDRETLGRLLQAWKGSFGNNPKMVRDAVNRANESFGNGSNELYEILSDIAGDRQGINRKMLGHWIKRNANRIVDGLRFVRASGNRSAVAWLVESVS